MILIYWHNCILIFTFKSNWYLWTKSSCMCIFSCQLCLLNHWFLLLMPQPSSRPSYAYFWSKFNLVCSDYFWNSSTTLMYINYLWRKFCFVVIVQSSCSFIVIADLILERENNPSNLHFTFHFQNLCLNWCTDIHMLTLYFLNHKITHSSSWQHRF